MKPQGYGCLSVDGRVEYAHRIAWKLTHKEAIPNGLVIDHICLNRDCVNPSHLRVTTRRLNNEYRTRGRVPVPESGIRGVYRATNSDKWLARVRYDGVVHNLGLYEDKEEAGRVVAAKRDELFQFPEYLGEVA